MADRIIENIYSDTGVEANPAEPMLDEACAVRRRVRRGRPKGTGRKHPERCSPKTFRFFSPLAQGLLSGIRLTDPELMRQTEAEIIEEALVRLARSLSNRNSALAKQLERAGR